MWRTSFKRLLFEGEVLRLMGLTLLIKPIGLVTQMLMAKHFGAGAEYDAYAFSTFLVLFLDTFIGQSYNAIAVPVTIQLRERLDRDALLQFQNAVLAAFLVPVLAYMTLLLLGTPLVVKLLGPNLPAETYTRVVPMVRWLAIPGLALMSVTMVKAILNLNHRYSVAGSMPLLNAIIVLGVLLLTHRRWGILSLVAGFAAAAITQIVIIIVFAFRTGSVALARPQAPPGQLKRMWSMGWVFIISQVLLTGAVSVDKIFATGLPPGSVSSISYSSTILNMGIQLFSFSLVVVMFTRMSELIAAGRMAECNAYILDNLNRQARLVVPVSLALCLASGDIVRVLFQRGAFDAEDAARTAGVLSIYLLGLPAQIINAMVARVYHSLQRLRDRIWLNAQYLATILIGNLVLIGPLQVKGLALSATLAINLHLLLSFWLLSRGTPGLQVGKFVAVVARAYALAGMAVLVYYLTGFARLLDSWSVRHTSGGAVLVGTSRVAFICLAFAAGYLAWRAWARRGERT